MKLLTANRLTDGKVVWYAGEGAPWSHDFAEAVRVEPAEAEAALDAARAQPRVLVGPYLVEVEDDRVEKRERLRETIRAGGPTVGHSLQA